MTVVLGGHWKPSFSVSTSVPSALEVYLYTTMRYINQRFTFTYLLPKRVAQNAILLFCPVNFNVCRKKSSTNFLCVKTSSGKVVATPFLYLTVHRWIAGDVPINQTFELKVTHPFRKRWFRQISLNSAAAMRASEKNKFSAVRRISRKVRFLDR